MIKIFEKSDSRLLVIHWIRNNLINKKEAEKFYLENKEWNDFNNSLWETFLINIWMLDVLYNKYINKEFIHLKWNEFNNIKQYF